jgi:integrase
LLCALLCVMASIHKQRGRPYWFCSFTTSDGKRHFKSTGTTDKEAAKDICQTWQGAANFGDALSQDKAREILSRGIESALLAAGQTPAGLSVAQWCKRWLEAKELESESGTHEKYEQTTRLFLASLGAKANRSLETVTPDDVLRFRDRCARTLAPSTVNTHLKIVRACLNSARLQLGVFDINPASRVAILRTKGNSVRRAMTLEELKTVITTCGNTPWRGLVLLGIYTGQRLGDCASVTWQQIDLQKEVIWFVTQKTGKRLEMQIAKPLFDYLTAMPAVDNPKSFVFPEFAAIAQKRVGMLSNKFAEEVLIPSKLMLPRPKAHKATGRGRSTKRQLNPLTFHSLRHSFTTMLKATGASNALAQLIVGHDSSAVSAHYTHLRASDTTEAINKLADVTKPQ